MNALIGLGNITYLAEELEPTGVHSFEEPQEGVTLAYGRDRGAENTSATRYNSAQEYSHIIRNAAGTERVQYAYLYREQEGAWYWLPMHCSGSVRIFQPLTYTKII